MTRWRRLSVLLGLALLAACTESHVRGPNDGKPRDSTETGNPPVIDISAIALVVRSSAVHIVGEPGAVTPGGIEVEIDNLRSGEEQRGSVAQDGSFDVQVSGSMDDTYAVRALGAIPAAVSTPVYVHRGDASVEQGLSCEERADVIEGELTRVTANVDVACTSNADCTQLTAFPCPRWPCGGPVASRPASTALAPAIEAVITAWCEPFERDDCFFGMAQPGCIASGPFACVDQKCVDCLAGDCDGARCDGACTTPNIEWTVHAGASRETYALSDCKTLTAPSSCTSEPPCVVSRDTGDGSALSIADLQNKLAAPEVEAALADETSFGALTPGGFFTEVSVGGRSFLLSRSACEGTATCNEAPPSVSDLVQALESFAAQYTCE